MNSITASAGCEMGEALRRVVAQQAGPRRAGVVYDNTDGTLRSEIVFTAPARGDVLRRTRSLHPRSDALTFLADTEAAAAASALLLENAYRQHQQNLDRVDRARQSLLLAPTTHVVICPPPVPFTGMTTMDQEQPVPPPADDLQIVKTNPEQPDLHEGLARIVRVDDVTEASKMSGLLTTASGRDVRWTTAASYADALEELFTGVPAVVRGFFTSANDFVLTLIRAASREEWNVPDAGREDLMVLGQDAVTEAARIRKGLLRMYGPACQLCEVIISKSRAAVWDNGDRMVLVCHPCKARRKTLADDGTVSPVLKAVA
ncbi:hypothetical protein [Streptomyces hebeiensis]